MHIGKNHLIRHTGKNEKNYSKQQSVERETETINSYDMINT
ncbi:MAG TPA: hypothetical protein VMS35_02305 [Nitrososphaeraceae archaeon]|nr:hypothetical protein [Nitrososphaeraceae archaeon]